MHMPMRQRRMSRQEAPQLSVDVSVKSFTVMWGLGAEPPKVRIEGQIRNNPALGSTSTMVLETRLRREIGDAIQMTMSEEFADLVIQSWTKGMRSKGDEGSS